MTRFPRLDLPRACALALLAALAGCGRDPSAVAAADKEQHFAPPPPKTGDAVILHAWISFKSSYTAPPPVTVIASTMEQPLPIAASAPQQSPTRITNVFSGVMFMDTPAKRVAAGDVWRFTPDPSRPSTYHGKAQERGNLTELTTDTARDGLVELDGVWLHPTPNTRNGNQTSGATVAVDDAPFGNGMQITLDMNLPMAGQAKETDRVRGGATTHRSPDDLAFDCTYPDATHGNCKLKLVLQPPLPFGQAAQEHKDQIDQLEAELDTPGGTGKLGIDGRMFNMTTAWKANGNFVARSEGHYEDTRGGYISRDFHIVIWSSAPDDLDAPDGVFY